MIGLRHRGARGSPSSRSLAGHPSETDAAGPTTCCSAPATPTPSTTPAAAPPSASSCPLPSTSTAPPWRPSTRSSASTRAAPCAYLGEIEGANLIKLHRRSGKVSYLVYPDFDADPHPALLRSIKLNLRTREIESTDYAASPNPPVLHRKEAFLRPDDPRRAKFERLTGQEERAGLLDDTATIGTRAGWSERLRERGYALRGHRLVRSRAGDGPTGGRSGDGSG